MHFDVTIAFLTTRVEEEGVLMGLGVEKGEMLLRLDKETLLHLLHNLWQFHKGGRDKVGFSNINFITLLPFIGSDNEVPITTRNFTCSDWVDGRAYWKWDHEVLEACTSKMRVE